MLLAAGLFLLGVQTRMGEFWLRAALVSAAGLMVVGTTVWILRPESVDRAVRATSGTCRCAARVLVPTAAHVSSGRTSRLAGVDEELDRLFGLPLDEFTSARNDLAKRLRTSDAETAETVAALSKPTISAWTVNQLSREDRSGVEALLEAGVALRDAQGRLLAGDDAAEAVRDATTRERDAVDRLSKRARTVLAEAGRASTQGTLDRIAATLRAAAVSDEGRVLLAKGRLTADLEPSGFDLVAASATAGRRRPTRKSAVRCQDRQQQRRRELQEQFREAERAAQEAEREAEWVENAAAEARRIAAKARAVADKISAELAAARKR